eukprot:15440931-Alexandrium_andersonii.AAC.1
MADAPRGQGRTPSAEARCGPRRAAPSWVTYDGKSTSRERLGVPLRGDPNCRVNASSPTVRRLCGGCSEGAA